MNETAVAATGATQTVSPWVFVILVIGSALIVIALLYINYLREKNLPKKKTDPITRALVVSALIFFLFGVIPTVLDVWTVEELKEKWWAFGLLFILMIALFLGVSFLNQPQNPRKLYKRAENEVEYFTKAMRYSGPAWVDEFNIILLEEGRNKEVNVGDFNVLVNRETVHGIVDKFWVKLDNVTGYLKRLQPHPPDEVLFKLTGVKESNIKSGLATDFEEEESVESKNL